MFLRFLCAILFIFFTSCQKKESGSSSSSPKKTLHVNFSSSIPTLDPRRCSDPVSSTGIFMLYEGLTRHTKDSSTSLGMAKKIDISPDLKTYTFHLREAYWSNGERVTATDFEQSWKDMLTPSFPAPNANLLYPVKNASAAKRGDISLDKVGITSESPYILRVELEKPTPYFLEITSFCALFPTYHPKDPGEIYHPEVISNHLITNGPFQIIRCKIHDEIELQANPYYYRKNDMGVERVLVSFISDDMTVFDLFQKKQIDIIGHFLSSIPSETFQSLKKTGNIQFNPIAATTFLAFNLTKFPFNNFHIRKAIHHAIDRNDLIENITQLGESIAVSLIPPIMKKDQKAPQDVYNIELAKYHFQKGLEELGITANDIPSITMIYLKSETHRKIAQALQDQLTQILGLNIQIQETEVITYLDKLYNRNYQLAFTKAIAQYNDQMDLFSRFENIDNSKNYPGWDNSDYLHLLNVSRQTIDLDKRLAIYQEAENVLSKDLPISPIYHFNASFIQQPNVTGFLISAIGSIHIDNIHFREDHEI